MNDEREARVLSGVAPEANQIDNLIEAGWYVLESGFDPTAFLAWRQRAFHCLMALLGPDHPYTEYFKNFVIEAEKCHLLAGTGILAAAKEKASLQLSETEISARLQSSSLCNLNSGLTKWP